MYVICKGGLGNQLFILATTFALSQETQKNVVLLDQYYESKLNRYSKVDNFGSFHLKQFPLVSKFIGKEKFHHKFIFKLYTVMLKFEKYLPNILMSNSEKIEDVRKSFVVHGNMQNPKKFSAYKNLIINLLQLDPRTEDNLDALLKQLSNGGKSCVAIHVRRGDYLDKKVHGPVLSRNFYLECMKHFNGPNYNFLLFSDDLDWCQKNLVDNRIEYISEKDPVISFRLMSKCDHFIISSSTYSWWAAWISSNEAKKVLAPYPFFKDDYLTWESLRDNSFINVTPEYDF
jgi:hypothetical protein